MTGIGQGNVGILDLVSLDALLVGREYVRPITVTEADLVTPIDLSWAATFDLEVRDEAGALIATGTCIFDSAGTGDGTDGRIVLRIAAEQTVNALPSTQLRWDLVGIDGAADPYSILAGRAHLLASVTRL